MPYAYTQTVPIDEATYRNIMTELGPEPLTGLLVHLAVRRGERSLEYIDVWESFEACERAFEERIHPAVFAVFSKMGFRPDGEPEKTNLDVVDLYGVTYRSETAVHQT